MTLDYFCQGGWQGQTPSALLANYHRSKDDSFTHTHNTKARRVPQARFLCLGLGLDFSLSVDSGGQEGAPARRRKARFDLRLPSPDLPSFEWGTI